jgi:hypothetical protein
MELNEGAAMRARSLGAIGFALALMACERPAADAPEGNAATRPSLPVEPPSSSAATSPSLPPRLSVSASGGCWLRSGQVWCWNGAPTELESAAVHATVPSPLRPLALPAPALDAAGTLRFGCALLASGGVQCWGDNTWGQLGAASLALASEVPLAALGLEAATSIAVASEHACATLKDGSVACWGSNTFGQCGHDREYAPAVRQLVRPERVEGVHGARRVVVSATSSCALGESDTWCWGELLRANDGNGPATDRTRASRIAPLSRARALALGNECGCAIDAEGRVACFSLSLHGCPSADVRAALEPLFGWSDVVALAVGDRGACAGRAAGGTACWLHPSRDPSVSAPIVATTLPLTPSASGVPVIADGPCIFDVSHLDCRGSGFWDNPTTKPRRIRLP